MRSLTNNTKTWLKGLISQLIFSHSSDKGCVLIVLVIFMTWQCWCWAAIWLSYTPLWSWSLKPLSSLPVFPSSFKERPSKRTKTLWFLFFKISKPDKKKAVYFGSRQGLNVVNVLLPCLMLFRLYPLFSQSLDSLNHLAKIYSHPFVINQLKDKLLPQSKRQYKQWETGSMIISFSQY